MLQIAVKIINDSARPDSIIIIIIVSYAYQLNTMRNYLLSG
jgi:hypothetical protein